MRRDLSNNKTNEQRRGSLEFLSAESQFENVGRMAIGSETLSHEEGPGTDWTPCP